MKRAWTLLPFVVAALAFACDNRACLAQSELFAVDRALLLEDCCLCLARRGTVRPGASCGEAQLTRDGGVLIADGGTAIADDGSFDGDDGDDVIDDFELACLCGSNASSCQQTLGRGESIVVPGACVSQQGGDLLNRAPCEEQCRGVLTFDPPTVAP